MRSNGNWMPGEARLCVAREPSRIQAANRGNVTRILAYPRRCMARDCRAPAGRSRARIRAAASPAQQAGTLVDPFVAGDHLMDPHQPEAEQSEREAYSVID